MSVTEQELKAKSTAIRVTADALADNIATINYLNVGEALDAEGQPVPENTKLLTICVLTLRNGFVVTGESACASPENFDRDIGQRIALENAKNKIWPLMGYELRSHLMFGGQTQLAQPARSWLDGDARQNGVR